MKHYILILVAIMLLASCDSKKKNWDSETESTEEIQEKIQEDSNEAQKLGYKKGYDDGYEDGYEAKRHGYNYNSNNSYQTDEAQSAYKSGYSNGYDDGYKEGEAKKKEEILSNWQNWEDEDVDAIYVLMEGVETDEDAEYIAEKYYDGEYIRDGWQYYAKISLSWGEYRITLGTRVNSHLYKIIGSDKYIHFKWLPDVDSGDDGVLKWSGHFSSFYKKPDL